MMDTELPLDLTDRRTLSEHRDYPLIYVWMLIVQPFPRAGTSP